MRGTARFTSTDLPSITWFLSCKTSSTLASLSKMTKPKPRDLFVSRLNITSADTTLPYCIKYFLKSATKGRGRQ